MAVTPEEERFRSITACFTGHRQLSKVELPSLVARLDNALEELWRRGYRRFVSGGARGFDTLAAERVNQLQLRHEGVELILVIPCADQAKTWTAKDSQRYERMLYAADQTHVLSPSYYPGCMMVRNRYMVDRSSFCLCYLTHMKGGTVSTAAYASQQGIPLLNVAMEDACAAFCAESAK